MDAWVRLHVELAESQPKVLQKLQPTFQPQSIQSSLKVKICCQKNGVPRCEFTNYFMTFHDCILSILRPFTALLSACWALSIPAIPNLLLGFTSNLYLQIYEYYSRKIGNCQNEKPSKLCQNEKDIQNLCHNKKDISIDSVDIKNSSKMRKRQPELKARKSVGTLTWSTREATANEPNLMSLRLQKGQKSYRNRTNSY